MATYGYARVSTIAQDTKMQTDALIAAGCAERDIFRDKISGKDMNRPGLTALLERIQPGDTIYVFALDRLSRSVYDTMSLIKVFEERQVKLSFIKESIAYDNTPAGAGNEVGKAMNKVFFAILSACAEIERNSILTRTKIGREQAMARGVRFGRPLHPHDKLQPFMLLRREGLSTTDIQIRLGMVNHREFAKLLEMISQLDTFIRERRSGAGARQAARLARVSLSTIERMKASIADKSLIAINDPSDQYESMI